jgi:hypothetical protein
VEGIEPILADDKVSVLVMVPPAGTDPKLTVLFTTTVWGELLVTVPTTFWAAPPLLLTSAV